MSMWGYVIFGALAVVIGACYAAGRIAGIGQGEQDRGDLAEELARALATVRHLEQRCADQTARIRALTQWEMIDHATHTVPGVLRALPVPRTAQAEDVRRVHRRFHPRPGRPARTAAFLAVAAVAQVGESVQDDELGQAADVELAAATSWDQWPVIMAQIAESRAWVASL
jgi:hypothetical protein